jgi:hypothetical protein
MNTDLTLERLPATAKRPVREQEDVNQSFLSKFAKFIPKEKWFQYTIVWSFFQLFLIGILEGCIVQIHNDYVQTLEPVGLGASVPNAKALIVYQILFILAQAFQLFLCIDAITSLSIIQIIATAVFNWALFGYSIMQYIQASNVTNGTITPANFSVHPTKTLEIVVIVLMSIFVCVWSYLAYKLNNLFGWKLYKDLGADVSMMKSLKLYHIYMMLLKLDIFFFFGFDIQFLVLVLINGRPGTSDALIHICLIIPSTIAVITTAFFAILKENRVLTNLALIGFFAGTIFLIERLVNVLTNTDGKYLNSKRSITFFISLTIALCTMTFIILVMNSRRYGRGLKEKLNH